MENFSYEFLHKTRFIAEVDLAERSAKHLSSVPPTPPLPVRVKQYGYAQAEPARRNSLAERPSRSFHSRFMSAEPPRSYRQRAAQWRDRSTLCTFNSLFTAQ